MKERKKNHEFFSEVEVVDFIKKMISVHAHLQSMNIAHRDIKPENIIITEYNDEIVYKLCDIGVGTISSGTGTKTRTLKGTQAYIAPELYGKFLEA